MTKVMWKEGCKQSLGCQLVNEKLLKMLLDYILYISVGSHYFLENIFHFFLNVMLMSVITLIFFCEKGVLLETFPPLQRYIEGSLYENVNGNSRDAYWCALFQ